MGVRTACWWMTLTISEVVVGELEVEDVMEDSKEVV